MKEKPIDTVSRDLAARYAEACAELSRCKAILADTSRLNQAAMDAHAVALQNMYTARRRLHTRLMEAPPAEITKGG